MKNFYLFVSVIFISQQTFSQSYDTSFDGDGFISWNDTHDGIGMIEIPTDIIYEETTGKIIMLNQFNGEGANLHRFNADGTHDSSFGVDGKEEIDLSSSSEFSNIFTDEDGYRLTGYRYVDPDKWSPFNEDINADGSINTSFGTGGIIGEYSIERAFIHAACKTSEGKYFLAGNLNSVGTYGAPIMSFNADGTYNTAFGFYSLEINELTNFYDVTELPDGRIIAIGETHDFPGDYFPIIACFLPDGGLDLSFSGDGIAMPEMPLPHLSYSFLSVTADLDGNILIGGNVRLNPADDGYKVYIAKFDTDGNLMTDFGTDGYAYTVTTSFCEIPKILVSSVGNIYGLSSGHLETDATLITHIFKFFPDGTPDTDFTNGEPGLFRIQVAGTSEYDDIDGRDMFMQPDGKLVVLGKTDGLSLNDDFWITRITSNETPVDVIDENDLQKNISIFPNPASEFISIRCNEQIHVLKIFSLDGKEQFSTDESNRMQNINIEYLEAGSYMLQVKLSSGDLLNEFFVKQ
ncbi:MAG: T9SS type A sorting domain-containing protein [Fimbriimonadaceae bacterium]|nr:T9SS type A sorting domain-containing protein [Chitinophagales bacterium]